MKSTAPHYLLFTQANDPPKTQNQGGQWKFVLEEIGSEFRIEESDLEPGVYGERLQLLAVVRGLERLEQPSLVTLVTSSKYVGRGIRSGLRQWRANQWQWEHFGQRQTIKHASLWRRIDAAMQYHRISCRIWQFDVPHSRVQAPVSEECDLAPKGPTPFVSTFENKTVASEMASTTQPKNPLRGQRIRLDVTTSKKIAGAKRKLDPVNHSNLLDRVKPIGEGTAFGYAMV